MNVPIGVYTLKAHYVGYKEAKVFNVRITGDSDVQTINFALSIESVKGAEIVVQARATQESEASARLSEKNAGNIINVVTAETIQRSPDRTSADVLKRVSGLSLQKDQGEGRYVIFRGMDQRYNNTTLNGIKVPSPEPKVGLTLMPVFFSKPGINCSTAALMPPGAIRVISVFWALAMQAPANARAVT